MTATGEPGIATDAGYAVHFTSLH